jgi:transposase
MSQKMSKRKRYTAEFKAEAVRLVESRGSRTVQEIAQSLGVAPSVLHSWRQTVSTATVSDRGETPQQELRRLRRENADLKRDREALLKSIAVAVRTRK